MNILAQMTHCMSAVRVQERELRQERTFDTSQMRNVLTVAQGLLDEAVGSSYAALFGGMGRSKEGSIIQRNGTMEDRLQS